MTAEREIGRPLSFIHSFVRYFDVNGTKTDRLQLILKHGILSLRNAQKAGIPFEQMVRTTALIPHSDEVIFVYSLENGQRLNTPRQIALFFDDSLEVHKPQELGNLPIADEELYVLSDIPVKSIRKIRVTPDDNIEEVSRMVAEYTPEMKDVVITSL